nr:uclacyanin-3-like [Ipomoea batatas]
MAVAVNFAILFVLLAVPAAFAADHVVGDSSGWTQTGDYTTWASSKTFAMGDHLVFNYGGSHGVDVVSKDDYDNCNAGNAIQSYTGGATTIKLSKSGPITTPTATSPPPNAAMGGSGCLSKVVVGVSIVVGALFAFLS